MSLNIEAHSLDQDEYEFDPKESTVFASASFWMKVSSAILILQALVMVWDQTLTTSVAIGAAATVATAVFAFQGATSFKKVVETIERDIHHTRAAMRSLKRYFIVQGVAFIAAAIAIVPLILDAL